jgi:uncharacterized membrane protein
MDTGSRDAYERIASGLGWFSLSLGMAEILVPGAVSSLAGVRSNRTQREMVRSPLYGMREVAAGVGILADSNPHGWLWSRVAGDVFDIGSLLIALRSPSNNRPRVKMALAAVMGVTALDVICAQKLGQTNGATRQSTGKISGPWTATESILINKSPEEAYSFWRDFENLPLFMRNLESVEMIDNELSEWHATGPFGKSFEWVARVQDDQPNRKISWLSVEGSEVQNSGTVSFEPGPGRRGTLVRVELTYQPPAGIAGKSIAKLLGKDADQMLADDLRAFKQTIETGEVIESDASIHTGMHPAQPSGKTRSAA